MESSVTQTYTIYKLIDPRDKLPHYVGHTCDPLRRYEEHIRGEGAHPDKVEWIAELLALGMKPSMEIIEILSGTKQEAIARELYWIQRLRDDGMPLTNKAKITPRVNRGVTLPEWMFSEYKISAAKLNMPMHHLMEEVLREGLTQVRARVAAKSR